MSPQVEEKSMQVENKNLKSNGQFAQQVVRCSAILLSTVSSVFAALGQLERQSLPMGPKAIAIPPPQSAFPKSMFSFLFSPESLFSDSNHTGFTVRAVEKDSSALPSWMSLKSEDSTLLGAINTPGEAKGVHVVGETAYVADYHEGLSIFNITNPAFPSLIGSYLPKYQHATGVYVVDNLGYVLTGFEGLFLEIIDVSTLPSPSLLGCYSIGPFREVFVVDSTAYLATDGRFLEIVSVADPSSPDRLSVFDTLGNANSVSVVGNYAYVASGSSGLLVLDVSDPSSPFLTSSFPTPSEATHVYVAGNTAYVLDESPSLQIVDISNSSSPIFVGSYDLQVDGNDLCVANNVAYIAHNNLGLEAIDIEDPFSPSFINRYQTPGDVLAVSAMGNQIFATDRNFGLHIFDPKLSLRGIPSLKDIGNYEIDFIATDPDGNQASLTFTVRVEGLPMVNSYIPSQAVNINAPFSYLIDQSVFEDLNNDVIFYSARLQDQDPLPLWLEFSPDGIFSGTPKAANRDNLTVEVSALDRRVPGATTTIFSLFVEHFPEVSTSIPNQAAGIDRSFSLTVDGTFTDADDNDALLYTTSNLPSWLFFNSNRRAFSGTPLSSDIGVAFIDIFATDPVGATASTTFRLEVGHFPDLLIPVPGQVAAVGLPYTYAVPGNTFSSPDGSQLRYRATKSDRSPLPNWLEFAEMRLEFYGTPQPTDKGVASLRLVAEDSKGGWTESVFQLNVASPLSEIVTRFGGTFVFTIPDDMISNPQGPVSYTVTLGDYSPLPFWMIFDADKNIISGVPPSSAKENYNILISADDGTENPVLGTVSLKVGHNARPQISNGISNQVAQVDQKFRFVVPDNTFTDPNDDPLTLTALKATGAKLPSWLSFQNRTLEGKPGPSHTGAFSDKTIPLQICASDGDQEVCSPFDVSVQGTSREETAVNILAPLSSFAALGFGWVKKRGLILNQLNRKKYDKGTRNALLGKDFNYPFQVDKSKIVRIQTYQGTKTLFELPIKKSWWTQWLFFDKPIPGGAPLPDWLKYDQGKNRLESKYSPTDDNEGVYTIRAYASGDVIVEKIRLVVCRTEKE